MDQISEIKQKINIVDLVGEYIELKKSGRNYKSPCPFHSEKTPSFMVSAELQIYKCFGCGESGDIFSFVQKIEGVDFSNALERLAEKAGVKLERAKLDPNTKNKKLIYEINEIATEFYEHLLTKHKIGKRALEYLQKERGLKQETIKTFRLGYAPNNWELLFGFLTKKGYNIEDLEMAGVITKSSRGNYIDKFVDRVLFPLIGTDNRVVGFSGRTLSDKSPKYLNTAETLVFHKSTYLYGLNEAKIDIKHNGAVFVEGQLDVISAFQNGIKNVIATSGTSLTLGQLKILARYTGELTFCFDSDTAGVNATMRAIELAEKEGFNIKIAVLPEPYGDLDELLKEKPIEGKEIFEDTITIYDFFVKTATEKFDTKTAYGKKKVMEYLKPKISLIQDTVVKEHYTKHLSKLLNTDASTIKDILNNKNVEFYEENKTEKEELSHHVKTERLTEEYLVALLFNAKLELAQNILYKLGKKDFTKDENRDIFVKFKDYVRSRKRQFKAKYFISKLENELKSKAEELYLTDLGQLLEHDNIFEREVETIFRRLKRDTINRELINLQSEMKEAELKNDKKKIEELSNTVYKISKLKKKYE